MAIKPVKTEFDGVVFRSKSEAQFAFWATRQGFVWEYEPQQFALGCGYVPDFLIIGRTLQKRFCGLLVEYKPRKPTKTYIQSTEEKLHGLCEMLPFPATGIICWGSFYDHPITCGQHWRNGNGLAEARSKMWLFKAVDEYQLRIARKYRFDLPSQGGN